MTMQAVEFSDDRAAAPPGTLAWRGIELCRQGDWQTGFYWLSLAAEAPEEEAEGVPSLFFAFLGYGLARFQGEVKEGIRLCRHAVHLEHYQAESYAYLARTYLLADDRRSAFDVVERGLQIDATDAGLKELEAELGERRPPVLPFLPRRHPLNRSLGRLRHRLFGPRRSAARRAGRSSLV